jgi:hypothetical protein
MTSALRLAGRVTAVVLGLGVVALNGLLCLYASAMQCDDSCSIPGRGVPWRDTAGAWQWTAIGWLGVASFVCAVLSVATVRWRPPVWRTFLVLAVLTGLAPWFMVSL